MRASPAEIFARTESIDAFRNEIRSCKGDFDFDAQDMIDLGKAYFKRYPDSYRHRNTSDVLAGYELARVCIMEKAIGTYDAEVKDCFRSMVRDVAVIHDTVQQCIKKRGYDESNKMYLSIYKKIDDIKFIIDTLPMGMIKERYIGGITLFYNISYIIQSVFKKCDI